MVDKKKSCPARGRKKKRAGAAETAGAGDRMRGLQTECRVPGLRKQPGTGAGAIAGQQVKTAPARAAGENGAGQGSG